jgi:hypothetical protein
MAPNAIIAAAAFQNILILRSIFARGIRVMPVKMGPGA